jgi:hypothetical protein
MIAWLVDDSPLRIGVTKVKRKGFFSRLADKLFGGITKPKRKARKQPKRKATPPPPSPPVIIGSDVEVETAHRNYTLTGWRVEGGDWQDVEAGADLPVNGGGKRNGWQYIDLVTVNLAPDSEDGFYRSARVLGGLDEYPNKPTYDFYDEDPSYTLDNLAYELALEYGFAVQ